METHCICSVLEWEVRGESGKPWNGDPKCVWEILSNCFFKVFFILKYIKIIFFLFLKIIFDINTLKWYEKY